jgi:large subunit ribosomal protein L19
MTMATSIFEKISSETSNARKVPAFRVGDQVKVFVKIREGDKERVQLFAGTVIARDGHGSTETFTVRRISYGEGVERVFPIFSPVIDRLEVERPGRVRRAKLYYLRGRSGKKARIREEEAREEGPAAAPASAPAPAVANASA